MKKKLFILILNLFIVQISFAQNVIKGKVFDAETNFSLSGVSVMIKKTSSGTITNPAGDFSIQSSKEVDSLYITHIGYKSVVVHVSSDWLEVALMPENIEVDEVVVRKDYIKPIKRTSDVIYTGSAITKNGIELSGISANTSVYNILDLMPGIHVENDDAYSLGEKSVRIRNVKNHFSGMTLEGFPNYGVMPIGARDDIFDMANMQQVSVYKGATPADLGTATGSKGGAIELQYKRPSEEFDIQVQQSVGTDNFTSSFARIDFFLPPSKTGVFLSYSYTQADKWKGAGKLGPRNNAAIAITQKIAKNTTLEIFANYNQIYRHTFRSLSYEQASNLDSNYYLDYNSTITGNPSEDMYYFDYNGGKYINKDIMGTLSHAIDDNSKISLKYYCSSEDAAYKVGLNKGQAYYVYSKRRDIDRMGVIPELSGTLMDINFTLGYWFESNDNNAYVYSSQITEEGLEDIGYSYYAVNDGPGQVHSPYLKLAYNYGKTNIQAGLKYFHYMDSETERYTSLTSTELSETSDPDLHTDKMTYAALLPTLGVGFNFAEHLEAYINYGKNYMRPYMYSPIISLYISNQEAFTDNGMNLQSIFDKWEMETSDNFDIGFRYYTRKITFSPSIFYALHHNVLASAYDPLVDLDYYQNVGELTSYGVDVECYLFLVKSLMLYINPTYNKMTYNSDINRANSDGSEYISIKGNQVPASPEWFVKGGCVYSIKNFDFTVRAKYTGIRYGDATNVEKIDAYTVVDASVKYSMKNVWQIKAFSVGLELKNIFNEKYIGRINVSDDSVEGDANYYMGSPFSMIGSVNIKF